MANKRVFKQLSVVCATLVCLFACGVGSRAQHEHHNHKPAEQTAAVKLAIPDVKLLDQDGRAVLFYSDLVKGKVVAINFIFTTCTTICPPLAATFSKVQTLMGDRVGKEIHLISISVDPVTDTPERLKAWGDKFGRRSGWTFVTGRKQDVDTLLRALSAYSSRKEDHTPMVIIGDDADGVWTRAYGLAPASKIVDSINAAIGTAPAATEKREERPR